MTDSEALHEALKRCYSVTVEYRDGNREVIGDNMPLWECINWAENCTLHWGLKYRDTFFITDSNGLYIMMFAWHNDIEGYQWSVVE